MTRFTTEAAADRNTPHNRSYNCRHCVYLVNVPDTWTPQRAWDRPPEISDGELYCRNVSLHEAGVFVRLHNAATMAKRIPGEPLGLWAVACKDVHPRSKPRPPAKFPAVRIFATPRGRVVVGLRQAGEQDGARLALLAALDEMDFENSGERCAVVVLENGLPSAVALSEVPRPIAERHAATLAESGRQCVVVTSAAFVPEGGAE